MLSLIVAIDDNFLIGNNNELPWYEPNDLKYFKKVTTGKAVLMGYNTYLSIINRLGKPLPKRENYILTYEKELPFGGIIVKDLDALIESYNDKELFVIGGKMVYESLLSKVEKLYLTRVSGTHVGNIFFPEINFNEFKLLSREKSDNLTFEVYELSLIHI